MDQEEGDHSLEQTFQAAVKVIRSLPEEGPFQPSDDMMLMFYSYYQQATMGPCTLPRPNGFWDSRGKAKWDAWCSLGNMTKQEAMKNYVEDIQLILETIPISDEVADLVQRLGNFYTEVDGYEEEERESGVGKRPFTRPFAGHEGELVQSVKKPTMEGFGGLWEDIQNLQDMDGSVRGLSVTSSEAEGSRESREMDREEERNVWRTSEDDEEREDDFNTGDEDEEEGRGWSPDPRFLMVEGRRWRSDTKGSGSSVEPSVSSFTNGTHSSLNSEVEEDELACSLEPSEHRYPSVSLNGHAVDQSDAASDRNLRSADSDNEEFCDSMEHLAVEERLSAWKDRSSLSGAASVRPNELWSESSATLKEAEQEVMAGCFKPGVSPGKHSSSSSTREMASLSPGDTCSSSWRVGVGSACGCEPRSTHPARAPGGNINEQIATALLRLQHDMTSVLHRLHTLEELTRSQSRPSSPKQEDFLPTVIQKFLRPSWWPLDISPLSVALTALWPLIAHRLVQLYLQRKRRKIP
ncbi:acyl-CoA-binding domain-containing protein 5A-like isoform X2 [Cololabis saira]|uniref:acyl-CoA-binding domain-containing protein 5A-like isoform X2 n=1 Tax=Cololabis saira TaxID=129043 RepID=UPI002AD43253|nr:acyl-CoA-binding domain-containing protein 5A-like isoform X2 [Cololabis saira]